MFYKLKEGDSKHILNKDSEVELGNLDIFSLLPDEFEFTIKVIEKQQGVEADTEASKSLVSSSTSAGNENVTRKRSFDKTEEEDGETTDAKKMKTLPDPCSVQSLPSSTSLMEEPTTSSTTTITTSQPEKLISDIKIKPDPDSTNVNASSLSSTSDLPSTSTIKSEPESPIQNTASAPTTVAIKPDPDVVKTEDASSTCQSSSAVPQPLPQPNIRPSCEFGIRCYRQTTEHNATFAHPMDNDYRRPAMPPSLPNSPLCQFGSSCYRRNPEHLRTFGHPPAGKILNLSLR